MKKMWLYRQYPSRYYPKPDRKPRQYDNLSNREQLVGRPNAQSDMFVNQCKTQAIVDRLQGLQPKG
jgi:hypothetical protein